jgi:hypothetical protein
MLRAFVGVLVFMALVGEVDAALIDSGTLRIDTPFPVALDTFDLDIQMIEQGTRWEPFSSDLKIFDGLTISLSDTGKEFFATSSTGVSPDPGFDSFVSFLTNGVDEFIAICTYSYGLNAGHYEMIATPESHMFGTLPDFQGYNIGAIGLVIDDLVFDSNELWFNLTYDLTLNVYDNIPVPIPGAIWLLGSGLIGLVGTRKKLRN